EKCCPQRDLGAQVKRVTRRSVDGLAQPASRPADGIDDLPTQIGSLGRNDQLLGYPLGPHKHCAHALLAAQPRAQPRPPRRPPNPPATAPPTARAPGRPRGRTAAAML